MLCCPEDGEKREGEREKASARVMMICVRSFSPCLSHYFLRALSLSLYEGVFRFKRAQVCESERLLGRSHSGACAGAEGGMILCFFFSFFPDVIRASLRPFDY